MSEILTTEEFRAHTAGNCGCCQGNAECADVPGSDGCCHDADDRRHSLMTISEWESGCDCHTMMRHDAALRADIARLTRERDEARERAAGLSRELLAAIQARDSYRASAELRVGMRREFEELLNVGDTTAPETFEAGLVRLRALLAAESRAEKAERERDAYRHEWNVSSRQQGAETRARYAAESRAARLEEKVRRIQSACGLPNPAEACRVILAIAAEEGK